MTMNTDTMHTTANTGAGRVRKVMTIRTSEEVKMARIQEKQEMMLAKRRALLDAVEQAVALPEMPCKGEVEEVVESIVTESCQQPVEVHEVAPTLKEQMGRFVGSITSFVDRMRIFVLEEG